MGRVVCVRGAGAVGVARDELLALLAFVVHRVAQRARHRREEEHETTAKDEDAAGKIEPFAARDLWEESISLRTVVCFVVSLFARGRARRVVVPVRRRHRRRRVVRRPIIVVKSGRITMGDDDQGEY